MSMTINQFMNETKGKLYDVDRAFGAQCWDYFARFIQMENLPVSTYCAITGYAGDLFKLRDRYGYSKYFDYVYSIKDLKDGDWMFWDKHVAIYYQGKQWGQNQNTAFRGVTSKAINKKGFVGALRYKAWQTKKAGIADHYAGTLTGSYKTLENVNMRTGGSLEYPSLGVLPAGTVVNCYGYYTIDKTRKSWYYVVANGKTGFIRSDLLARG